MASTSYGKGCSLQTQTALSGPYDTRPFFSGQNPSTTPVPVYASIYTKGVANTFYVQFTMLYPYNLGKDSCLFFAPGNDCWGSSEYMDDHVGDWESTTCGHVGAERLEQLDHDRDRRGRAGELQCHAHGL